MLHHLKIHPDDALFSYLSDSAWAISTGYADCCAVSLAAVPS